MFRSKISTKLLALLAGLMALGLIAAACGGGDDEPKEVIKLHDGQWATLWLENNVAEFIIANGYEYPVEQVQGTTGTMKVALPLGDLDVNLEMWRINVPAWYEEFVVQKGDVVDLAGVTDPSVSLPPGSKGQILASGGQAFYVPTYVVKGDPSRGIEASAPGLKSVFDLPNYTDVFGDPEEPGKGVMVNCIIGWQCQKINRAKWAAYGLDDTFNVQEPGSAAALDAAIEGAYAEGQPVLSYYWEPTSLINRLDMARLEEPTWTQECQDLLDLAVEAEPFESDMGCGYPFGDVHIGVYKGLVERAPEVTDFLANMFIGAKTLGELEAWKIENDADWRDAAVKYLKENEATWSGWIAESDVRDRVKDALAEEPSF